MTRKFLEDLAFFSAELIPAAGYMVTMYNHNKFGTALFIETPEEIVKKRNRHLGVLLNWSLAGFGYHMYTGINLSMWLTDMYIKQ